MSAGVPMERLATDSQVATVLHEGSSLIRRLEQARGFEQIHL